MADDGSYYEILGVGRDATAEQIKTAYGELAKQYHPDVNNTAEAAEKIRLINAANDILRKEESRIRYNLLLMAKERAVTGNMRSEASQVVEEYGQRKDQAIHAGINKGEKLARLVLDPEEEAETERCVKVAAESWKQKGGWMGFLKPYGYWEGRVKSQLESGMGVEKGWESKAVEQMIKQENLSQHEAVMRVADVVERFLDIGDAKRFQKNAVNIPIDRKYMDDRALDFSFGFRKGWGETAAKISKRPRNNGVKMGK